MPPAFLLPICVRLFVAKLSGCSPVIVPITGCRTGNRMSSETGSIRKIQAFRPGPRDHHGHSRLAVVLGSTQRHGGFAQFSGAQSNTATAKAIGGSKLLLATLNAGVLVFDWSAPNFLSMVFRILSPEFHDTVCQ